MTSITGGTQIPSYTTDATTLNRQETYDLRDAARYGDQLADVLGDLIATRRADPNSSDLDSAASLGAGIGRNLHPDDTTLQDIVQRAHTEGGPLANFLQDSTLAASVRAGQALSFEDAEALLGQIQSWSSTVRDSLPGSRHNSGLVWDRTSHSFSLDGRRVSLLEAYSEIRLKQANEIQTALAERANSLDLRNRNLRALGEVAGTLRDFLTDPAWAIANADDGSLDAGGSSTYARNREAFPLREGSNERETYDQYINRLDTEFRDNFGVSLLDQLGTQGITSFYASSADQNANPPQIAQTHVEALIAAIEDQQESLENDNAIAAQQNQRLEDQLRIIYTSISSFTSSDTAVAGSAGRQI